MVSAESSSVDLRGYLLVPIDIAARALGMKPSVWPKRRRQGKTPPEFKDGRRKVVHIDDLVAHARHMRDQALNRAA